LLFSITFEGAASRFYLYHVGFVSHLPNLCHVPQLLVDQRAFEHDQHEESEQRVVPILVQAPQANAEHLEK
jgi:hypothetical protein